MAVDILPVAHDARRPAWKRIGTMREAGLIAIILSLCVIM
ncbi:ABC transporter permease, partial [Sinorhizobium medicae]